MISEEFFTNVELYKRGLYEFISYYDHSTQEQVQFHPKQVQALKYFNDDTTTYVGYGGAARGGKSLLISNAALYEAFAYPGSRYLIGRRNLTTLWQTTWKTLLKTMHNYGFEDGKDYSYNGQKHELYLFHPSSEIIAKNLERKPSDQEATEFGSLEITKAFIDQSEHVDLKIIEKVGERVGTHVAYKYGLKGKLMECFNPAKNHVSRRYWVPFNAGTEKETRKFVRALPIDNPGKEAVQWVQEKEKEYQDGTMREIEYQKQVKGNFDYDDDKAALISFDAIMDYWNGQHVKKGEVKYLTIDVARKGKDKTVFRVWEGWVCTERYEMGISKVNEVVNKAKEIQSIHSIPNSKTIADEDGVGGGVVDYLGCTGFVNNSKPKKEQVGEFFVVPNYANLKSQCSILMAKKIEAREVVEICEDADIIDIVSEEMQQVKLKDIDKDGKLSVLPKDKIKENISRSPDDWDSIMMRMYFDLEQEFFVV